VKKEFRLPDVGEGLTEADIVSWHVKPGDTVTINQIIVDIETAKAVVEAVSGLSETEHWDRELTSVVTPVTGHWAKMAGWVAHQTRFPRARNER